MAAKEHSDPSEIRFVSNRHRLPGEIYHVPDHKDDHAVKFPTENLPSGKGGDRTFHNEGGRLVLVVSKSETKDNKHEVIRVIPLSSKWTKSKYCVDMPQKYIEKGFKKKKGYAHVQLVQGICMEWLNSRVGNVQTDSNAWRSFLMALIQMYGLEDVFLSLE